MFYSELRTRKVSRILCIHTVVLQAYDQFEVERFTQLWQTHCSVASILLVQVGTYSCWHVCHHAGPVGQCTE
eukprot:3277712-Rhodomonas_salina.1